MRIFESLVKRYPEGLVQWLGEVVVPWRIIQETFNNPTAHVKKIEELDITSVTDDQAEAISKYIHEVKDPDLLNKNKLESQHILIE